jgi:PAS domain S-box-containing protein
MRAGKVVPTGVERLFGVETLMVSKTDPRGVITYANRAFLDVSHYDEADVLGQPHNLIRHPDMPRVIFKVMWDILKSGAEIFAYVLNLAADGRHYWVLAHVTPSYDSTGRLTGYHSNRRSPDRLALASVQALYAQLCDEERRHARPADAMAASEALLNRRLRELGHTYETYVWSLTGTRRTAATRKVGSKTRELALR